MSSTYIRSSPKVSFLFKYLFTSDGTNIIFKTNNCEYSTFNLFKKHLNNTERNNYSSLSTLCYKFDSSKTKRKFCAFTSSNDDINTRLKCMNTTFNSDDMFTSNYSAVTNEEKYKFQSVLPELIDYLTSTSICSDIPEIKEWFKKMLEYNVTGGKHVRGLNVVLSYKILTNNLTNENVKLSYILGWCVEMLQAYYIVMDDIQDEAEIRRGVSPWYRLDGVGHAFAINDGLFIEAGIYEILKFYFEKQPYYLHLIDLFRDTTIKSIYGQALDLMAAKWSSEQNFSKFNFKLYDTIVRHKTGYYTVSLPVGLSLHLAGIHDKVIHEKSKEILLALGTYFQVQDDYLDCFGDSSKTGKISTDIREGKCTWLAVNALKYANDQQMKIFRENFGYSEQSKSDRIKQLYEELNLPNLYKKYEEETYGKIVKDIQKIKDVPQDVFTNILNILFKRVK